MVPDMRTIVENLEAWVDLGDSWVRDSRRWMVHDQRRFTQILEYDGFFSGIFSGRLDIILPLWSKILSTKRHLWFMFEILAKIPCVDFKPGRDVDPWSWLKKSEIL